MKSLRGFPEDFEPLVIVLGDRREVQPRTRGDMLAYSVSSTDSMYLPLLRLEPRRPSSPSPVVVSDKQFVMDSEPELRRRFRDTNLLVIGSPAVNLLARQINQRSPFRFDISERALEDLAEQERFMEAFDDKDELFIYYQCLEGVVDVNTILARYVGQADFTELHQRAVKIWTQCSRRCSRLAKYRRSCTIQLRHRSRSGACAAAALPERGD